MHFFLFLIAILTVKSSWNESGLEIEKIYLIASNLKKNVTLFGIESAYKKIILFSFAGLYIAPIIIYHYSTRTFGVPQLWDPFSLLIQTHKDLTL